MEDKTVCTSAHTGRNLGLEEPLPQALRKAHLERRSYKGPGPSTGCGVVGDGRLPRGLQVQAESVSTRTGGAGLTGRGRWRGATSRLDPASRLLCLFQSKEPPTSAASGLLRLPPGSAVSAPRRHPGPRRPPARTRSAPRRGPCDRQAFGSGPARGRGGRVVKAMDC